MLTNSRPRFRPAVRPARSVAKSLVDVAEKLRLKSDWGGPTTSAAGALGGEEARLRKLSKEVAARKGELSSSSLFNAIVTLKKLLARDRELERLILAARVRGECHSSGEEMLHGGASPVSEVVNSQAEKTAVSADEDGFLNEDGPSGAGQLAEDSLGDEDSGALEHSSTERDGPASLRRVFADKETPSELRALLTDLVALLQTSAAFLPSDQLAQLAKISSSGRGSSTTKLSSNSPSEGGVLPMNSPAFLRAVEERFLANEFDVADVGDIYLSLRRGGRGALRDPRAVTAVALESLEAAIGIGQGSAEVGQQGELEACRGTAASSSGAELERGPVVPCGDGEDERTRRRLLTSGAELSTAVVSREEEIPREQVVKLFCALPTTLRLNQKTLSAFVDRVLLDPEAPAASASLSNSLEGGPHLSADDALAHTLSQIQEAEATKSEDGLSVRNRIRALGLLSRRGWRFEDDVAKLDRVLSPLRRHSVGANGGLIVAGHGGGAGGGALSDGGTLAPVDAAFLLQFCGQIMKQGGRTTSVSCRKRLRPVLAPVVVHALQELQKRALEVRGTAEASCWR